jgi:hypothetical protein
VLALPGVPHSDPMRATKTLFIVFVDAIFTTLVERLFTIAFDVIGAESANGCVCRERNAD